MLDHPNCPCPTLEQMGMAQHDHHCRLTAGGHDWHITRKQGSLIYLWGIDDQGREFKSRIDIGGMDVAAYCEAALAWDERREESQ